MTFVGADASLKAVGEGQQTTVNNYLRGSEQQSVVDVPSYARVRYQEIYPGIEMVFMGELEWLRYDFVIAPGAKPEVIQLRFEWAEKLELDTNGDLLIQVGQGEEAIVLRQKAPIAYQEVDGVRQPVQSRFVLNGDIVSFDLGSYDASLPLIIDPYLTFMGFISSAQFEQVSDIALDSADIIYIVGASDSPSYPRLPSGIHSPNVDVFVAKVFANGGGTAGGLEFGQGHNTEVPELAPTFHP